MGFEVDMPEGWVEYIFSDAVEINPKRLLKKGEIAPFIEMKALNPDYRTVEKISKRLFKGGGSRFKNGDTLFARITPCLEHGKIAYINKLEPNQVGHGSTEFIVMSGKEGITDNLFVYYLSRWDEVRNFAIKNMDGTSGRQRVPHDIFKQIRFKIPPLPEQQKIASILGALDDKIELNHEMNKTLEQMAQAIFKSWFVDFEPFQDGEFEYNEELGKEIPKGWGVKPVGGSCKVVGGGTPSTKVAKYWDGGTIHWATPKDLSMISSPVLLDTSRKITEEGLEKISSRLLPIDTVLLSSRAPIGYIAIAKVPVAINQGFIAMIPTDKLSGLFLFYWTKENIERIKARSGGTTFGEINKRNFRPMLVVIPPKEIINQFDNTVCPLFDKITNNEQESKNLAQLRDTLLPKLLSGEIRVNDINLKRDVSKEATV